MQPRLLLWLTLGLAAGAHAQTGHFYGIRLLPNGLNDIEADVHFGVMVSAQCRHACYAMRGGNKFAWEVATCALGYCKLA
jgi:hypothetical protein